MGKGRATKLISAQGGHNLKTMLRHEHLKHLALWASDGDTPIPSLATLLGRRLAADGEAAGIATDPDLVSCQRCEIILQPGFNCNVRIDKKKHMRCKNSNICLPQNNVVYYCRFCSQRNLKRGTAKAHMKDIYPSKPKTLPCSSPKIKKEMMMVMPQEIQSNINMFYSPAKSEIDKVVVDTPKLMFTLERDKRRRKSKSKKPIELESVRVGGSNKSKRKLWTSVKEITETNKSSTSLNLKLHFLL